jgi:4-hydroxy-tetrahydrodipicolinate reductase
MGGAVTRVVTAADDAELVGACTEPGHADVGRDVGELAGVGVLGVTITDDISTALADADVAIDFTLPVAVVGNLEACVTKGCALVMGTTGLEVEQQAMLKDKSSSIPIL